MAQITVRKLDESVVRALKLRAAAAGRSTEAEVRAILQDAVASKHGPVDFVQHLLAIPGDSTDDDLFPRIPGDLRDVAL